MTEVKVTIFYNWDTTGNGCPWHCGSLNGARKFVEEKLKSDEVEAYCIEVIDWMPIDRNDPEGQLYGGLRYHEFKEVSRSDEVMA